jgi:hypothetical protein
MAFNIQNFIGHIGKYNELARADKFDVTIPLPRSLRAEQFGSRELQFQCEAAELPGRNITMIEYRHHAFTERVPHITNFTDVNLTFLCNNRFEEKKFFDKWLNSMIPINTGLVKYYFSDSGENSFTSEIKIRQYDLTGKKIYNCTLIEAIPTAISPLTLSWSDDTIHRLQVSFSFKKWKTDDITDTITVA